jgi:hypothetical protein
VAYPSWIVSLRSWSGATYLFTVEGMTVKVRDQLYRKDPWTAFELPVTAFTAVAVTEMENGILKAIYLMSDGTLVEKYSEDDGETWR